MQDMYMANELTYVISSYLEDIYEYEYDYDEYSFIASGLEEKVEEYVYGELGLPELNESRRKVEEIAKKIAEGTGREELKERGMYETWSNLEKFAAENGVEFDRKDAPIDKHDLHAHNF